MASLHRKTGKIHPFGMYVSEGHPLIQFPNLNTDFPPPTNFPP